MSVVIMTSLGEIAVDLFTDRCPLTCKNFLKLCKINYYNDCLFHTVWKGFIVHTGDPTGTGSGGDSIYKFLYGDLARFFLDEIHSDLKHSKRGTLAMANGGKKNGNASQFYITLRDTDLDYLDGEHTVFGEIKDGFDTLNMIDDAYVDDKGKPFQNIRIKHTEILSDPFVDPFQLSKLIPDASRERKPKEEIDVDVPLDNDWVPTDEELGLREEKEAHVLESLGDIPYAEMKPRDNVLWVCNLNSITQDEDLYIIFSRFGTVTSAKIIRHPETRDSQLYGFIEFEDRESCEQAYLKMDNTLIDDRRIKVDFSQSAAKSWCQNQPRNQTGRGRFNYGSAGQDSKQHSGDGNEKYSKFLRRTIKERRKHGGRKPWQITKSR